MPSQSPVPPDDRANSQPERTEAPPTPAPTPAPPGRVGWEPVVQLIGAIAGLVAWVAVVGAARTWARLYNAGLPALDIMSGMNQQWFFVDGVQALVAPILIGLVASTAAYFLWLRQPAHASSAVESGGRSGEEANSAGAEMEAIQSVDTPSGALTEGGTQPAKPERQESPSTLSTPPASGSGKSESPESSSDASVLPGTENSTITKPDQPADVDHAQVADQGGAPNLLEKSRRIWSSINHPILAVSVTSAVLLLIMLHTLGVDLLRLIAVYAVALLIILSVAWVLKRLIGAVDASGPKARVTVLGAACAAAIVVIVVPTILLLASIRLSYYLMAIIVSAVIAVLLLAAFDLDRPLYAAIAIFTGLALWSGVMSLIHVAGNREVAFTSATIERVDGSQLSGYFIDRSADFVVIAQPWYASGQRPTQLLAVPVGSIRTLTFGGTVKIDSANNEPGGDVPTLLWPRTSSPSGTPTPPSPVISTPSESLVDTKSGQDDSPTTPSPSPVPDDPTPDRVRPTPTLSLAATAQIGAGAPVQLWVAPLKRSSGDFIELDARIVNQSDQTIRFSGLQPPKPGVHVSALTLFDPVGSTAYSVAKLKVDGKCLCDPGEDEIVIAAHQERRIAAAFEVPSTVPGELDLLVPHFGWVHALPVA